MSQNGVMTTGSSMEIIRQRLFIDHDSKHQRKITVEYTIRSKLPKLKNIFLNYDKFLPSLIIQDEKNNILPLMSSKDIEILYTYHIENSSGSDKSLLENELKEIQDQKKHIIWISLKDKPLLEDQITTFTLTYLPQLGNVKNPEIFIKINTQNFPVYYSLFSPNSFNFEKPNFITLKNDKVETGDTPPEHVEVYNSYHSMSLRVRDEIDYDFGLTYSLTAAPTSKILTKINAVFLCIMPIMYFLVINQGILGFELFLERKIMIGLFVIGASLVLPNIQPDQDIRKTLMIWYLLPTILGLLMVFF